LALQHLQPPVHIRRRVRHVHATATTGTTADNARSAESRIGTTPLLFERLDEKLELMERPEAGSEGIGLNPSKR
jgi:hypothetical protein